MEKWIKRISGTIPYTNKTVDIELNGKNLIVTGANGSGKTSFVKAVWNFIDNYIVSNFSLSNDEPMYVETNNCNFYTGHYERVRLFFEEKRLAEIKEPKIGLQIATFGKLGSQLEQHLLNLKMRASFAVTEKPNAELVNEIQKWFNNFEKNLKKLFEDENLTLELNLDEINPHFEIIQKDKPPFTFQTLSAGYRAIFDIYADLIMHTEYFKIMPNELTGVVFIDEIDSHLHVSLQRLILPFFTQSFPKIQFIVTTHSPFVLMSTPDTVVYDLAKNEPITADLSYYTYSAVMEGLWDVKPIAAWVENKIKEIEKIINSENKDIPQLRKLVDEMKGREGGLDSESKAIFLLGKQTLLKEERKNV